MSLAQFFFPALRSQGCILILALFALAHCSAANGDVLWEADFSSLEAGPSDYGKNLVIRQEGDKKILSKQDSETQFIFQAETKKAGGAKWNNYVYRVCFRETDKSTASLVIKIGGERPEVAYMQYYVGFSQKTVGVTCHGLAKDLLVGDPRRQAQMTFEELAQPPVTSGDWITAEVTVGEDVVKVSIDAGDQVIRVAEFKILPGSGSVALLARSPIDIASASVRDAGEIVLPTPTK
ncbi:hypothetical protein BH09VER1_BH09VER1_08190 [soil metagenome]